MEAKIFYQVKQAGGSIDRFETKQEALEFWAKVVNYFADWCFKASSPSSGIDNWIPSLKWKNEQVVENPNGWQISASFSYSVECEENGIDVRKVFRHTLSTVIEPVA